jgi:hypothetical protein
MKITYRQEMIKCGKKNCKRCPHGPYWYSYWTENGKLKKKYLGKHKDARPEAPAKEAKTHVFDAIFRRGTATEPLAKLILGIPMHSGIAEWQACFKKATLASHPDRGGSTEQMQRVQAAWQFLKSRYAC